MDKHDYVSSVHCKDCHSYYRRSWNNNNREKARTYIREYMTKRRLKEYGITEDEVIELVNKSRGLCAICLDEPAKEIDHNHKTGKVRGIVCGRCNKGLGLFRDNPQFLLQAIEYLVANDER